MIKGGCVEGLIGGLERFHLGVDVFELGVAIGLLFPSLVLRLKWRQYFSSARSLGILKELTFNPSAKPRANFSWLLESRRQRSRRISHRRGLEQSLKVFQKSRGLGRRPRLPRPREVSSRSTKRDHAGLSDRVDRTSRDLRRARGRRDPAVTRRLRLRRGGQRRPRSSSKERTASYGYERVIRLSFTKHNRCPREHKSINATVQLNIESGFTYFWASP